MSLYDGFFELVQAVLEHYGVRQKDSGRKLAIQRVTVDLGLNPAIAVPCRGAAICRRASRCSDALRQSRRNLSSSLTANCAPTARLWPCTPHGSPAAILAAITPACQALTNRQTAHCLTPPGHRVPVPTGRGRMQGKIKGHDTAWRESPVCTWVWRGTHRITAPFRIHRRSRASIGVDTCLARWAATALDGGKP